MPSKIKITGKPLEVRKTVFSSKTIYLVDFNEGGNSNSPKGLPQPSNISTTVLINEKQYKKYFLKRNISELFLLIEGEITLDIPSNLTKGNFGVVCFKIEELQSKK